MVLAEDHAIVRQGLRNLLEAEGDFEVVGQAESGREAVELAASLSPDVILMDIAMPVLNGLRPPPDPGSQTRPPRSSYSRRTVTTSTSST